MVLPEGRLGSQIIDDKRDCSNDADRLMVCAVPEGRKKIDQLDLRSRRAIAKASPSSGLAGCGESHHRLVTNLPPFRKGGIGHLSKVRMRLEPRTDNLFIFLASGAARDPEESSPRADALPPPPGLRAGPVGCRPGGRAGRPSGSRDGGGSIRAPGRERPPAPIETRAFTQ